MLRNGSSWHLPGQSRGRPFHPPTPQELLNIGTSYEEVIGQLRGAAGLGDEAAPDGGVMDGGARGYERAARDMGVADELLRGDGDHGAAPPAPMPALPRRALEAREEDERVKARADQLLAAAAAGAGGGAAPSLADIAAALADARAPSPGDASPADDEAPDGALGAFDRMAEAFDFDQQRKTVGAVDDVAAAPPIGLADAAAVVKDGIELVDEAPDKALSKFDHMDFTPPGKPATEASAAAAAARGGDYSTHPSAATAGLAGAGKQTAAVTASSGSSGAQEPAPNSVLQWLAAGALALLASGGGMLYVSEHSVAPKAVSFGV
jgi:hypothetical protein